MTSYQDAQDLVYNVLGSTATVTALIYSGSTNIYAAGRLRASDFDTIEAARRTAGTPNLVLAVTVGWGGERRVGRTTNLWRQNIVVRVHDRPIGNGYNIKRIRDKISVALEGLSTHITGKGLVNITYMPSGGLEYDVELQTTFEALFFSLLVSDHVGDGRP